MIKSRRCHFPRVTLRLLPGGFFLLAAAQGALGGIVKGHGAFGAPARWRGLLFPE